MAHFQYIARDKNGEVVKGIVESTTAKNASNLLHEQGFFITSLKEVKPTSKTSVTAKFRRVSSGDIVMMTRQLSTMMTAGLTLIEALSILSRQITKPALYKLVTDLRDEVQGGSTFAKALERHSKTFSNVYMALVRAGEASGKMDTILLRLAETLEKSRSFQAKIKGALLYPVIVLVGMVVVSIIVMVVVVPRLTGLYGEFGLELPLPTRILITISNGLVSYGWVMGIILIVLSIFITRFVRTRPGQIIVADVTMSIPVIGNLIKETTLVEITRTLSILVESGVPILTSLEIARDATSNVRYRDAFTEAARRVEKGFPLSDPFLNSDLFPPILSQMVSVGEQTGKLGDSLLKLSLYMESEAELAIKSLTTLMEPLIMVVLGLGVAFLVMAVLLPIYSLTSKF